jgi:processive 1,2-diacylglycerol beta-glucosyltransferase
MRVLILSCNTGEGHNSCGKALLEEFQANQIPCEMDDAFRFISPWISHMISFGFVRIYRYMPGLFRFGYRYSEEHPGVFKTDSGIYKILTAGADRLHRFIRENGYDAIICTHVFSALIVSEILRRHALSARTYFVATDYTCSPSCGQSTLDTYFIPDASIAGEFVSCGIPEEKLVASGIPIRRAFFQTMPQTAAKESCGLPPESRHLMVMCGSMGCGPIRTLVRQIAESLPENSHVSVICGTNQRLRKHLDRDHAQTPRVHIYSYVNDIPRMMDSADLYLTKPGGISVTEAAHKHLPMLFVDAVAGCEAYNMRFFIERGTAVTAVTTEELAAKAISLMGDEAALQQMKQHFSFPDHSPAAEIAAHVIRAGSAAPIPKERVSCTLAQ